MQYCELCGEKIGGMSVYSCKILPNQKEDTTLCKNCAFCFNARHNNNKNGLIQFINWSDNLLQKDRLNEPYRTQMIRYNKDAKDKIVNNSENDSADNTGSIDNSNQTNKNNYSSPVSIYSNKSTANTWIKITKIMGYVGIVGLTIIGSIIGLRLFHPILGGLLGFILGICSCSFVMMIASLCEDVAEIKNRLR